MWQLFLEVKRHFVSLVSAGEEVVREMAGGRRTSFSGVLFTAALAVMLLPGECTAGVGHYIQNLIAKVGVSSISLDGCCDVYCICMTVMVD